METSLQKIIAAIVGVMIMFIIPVYIAFEKADDVSYSLAVKLTQNFVDNVRNKGYISPEMYSDFISGLYATNNTYDVNVEHVKKRYDPAIYIYEKVEDESGERKGNILHILDYDRYENEYDNGAITIDVGIYNKTNSNIEVNEPSIKYDNGTPKGTLVKDKDGNELDARELYKDKIDQYINTGKIVIDPGEVYADVRKITGEAFDKDVYKPAIIDDSFKGQIKILNKQGTENDILPYTVYKDAYYNATNNIFWGPTYNSDSINYVPASMKIKGTNVSTKEAEEMYYERINEYRYEEASGDGRLVFDQGEIYADRDVVLSKGGRFDTKLDIASKITLTPGKISIKKDSLVEGYEDDVLDYDTYIAKYKSGQNMVIDGEIYADENSTIEDIKAGIWKKSDTINEKAAENLYKSQLDNLNKYGKVVVKKGEVYAANSKAEGYDSLVDEIRNIEIIGSITVKSPTGWEPTTLDFDTYINELRNDNKIEYLSGGTYDAERIEGKLLYELGGETFKFDYTSNEDKMLDDSDEITISVIYNDEDIVFGDVKPVVKVVNNETSEIISKEINTMSEIKKIADMGIVTIDEIDYAGSVKVGDSVYSSSSVAEYSIEIQLPEIIILEGKLASPVYVTSELNKYIDEYIANGNITKSQTYKKDNLEFQRETLQLKKDGRTVYELYHSLNKGKYDEYIESAMVDTNGDITKVTVEPIEFGEDELTVKYTQIKIEGREPIYITEENMYLVDQYYNNQRIVVQEPEILDKEDVNVRHAVLRIYEKSTNNLIYEFSGNVEEKHEDYDKYVKEYRSDKKITIVPTRVYTKDDVEVTPAKIVIQVLNEKNNKTVTFDDNHSKYGIYFKQFNETGKIKISEPEVYNVRKDFEVQDPHIQIRENGKVIIDIYEKDNKALYDEYKQQYINNKKVTLKYNISDIYAKRANITISKLNINDYSIIEGSPIVIEDNNPNYVSCLKEYQDTGIVTLEGATVYKKEELIVVDPSIIIRDPETGSIITKYEADFSTLSDEERYKIYEMKEKDYNEYSQIIDKKITYTDGENCLFEKAHVINEEVITDKQIVTKLFANTGVSKIEFLRQCMLGNGKMYSSLAYMDENSYVMNEGDQINVTVKNKNRTIASVFYNMLTANVGNEEIAKVYVDYGGTIKNDGETTLTEPTRLVNSKIGRLFRYTGDAQEVILEPGKYKIECWGAAGGYPEDADKEKVGKGAYASAVFDIKEETTLYVYVGGQGTLYSETNEANGGYNGGGHAYNAYGGGGATDVRLLKADSQDSASLLTRIIVAAGGGGNSKAKEGYGGFGGDSYSGENGISVAPLSPSRVGLGATNTSILNGYLDYTDNTQSPAVKRDIPESEKGGFGKGGTVDFDGAGAGGSGYFGGSASHDENAGGGGGISYIYNNQNCTIDGDKYPLRSIVAENYDEKVLNEILLFAQEARWKAIDSTSATKYIKGNEEMPKGIDFEGAKTMYGNKGNGYAIIKKCQSEGCED